MCSVETYTDLESGVVLGSRTRCRGRQRESRRWCRWALRASDHANLQGFSRGVTSPAEEAQSVRSRFSDVVSSRFCLLRLLLAFFRRLKRPLCRNTFPPFIVLSHHNLSFPFSLRGSIHDPARPAPPARLSLSLLFFSGLCHCHSLLPEPFPTSVAPSATIPDTTPESLRPLFHQSQTARSSVATRHRQPDRESADSDNNPVVLLPDYLIFAGP